MPMSKELKEERRAQGLCVYCGRPAVIKNVKFAPKQSIGSARGAGRRCRNRRRKIK